MGVQACQKVVFTRIGWPLKPDITETEVCETAITREQALAALAHLTTPGSSYCRFYETSGATYPWYIARCYPVDPVEISIKKPNWLQRIGIALSDFFSALVD